MIILKTRQQIEKMRVAGRIVADVLKILEEMVRPGITTADLNARAEEECKRRGAIPIFKNYPNSRRGPSFPGVVCASVNEEVVHGIPSNRILKDGDIVSIDFGVLANGFAGDSAITIPVGDIEPRISKLIRVTEECLLKGIKEAVPGNKLGKVSHAIQKYAEENGFSVVRELVGHGIGQNMHEDPPVPNYGRPDRGPVLKEGMTLAIEPMLNMGSHRVFIKADNWTIVTCDGSYSAHFEHTIAVSDKGAEILTLR